MGIKIKRIEIENFLGIKELKQNLGNGTLITGGNGQGKTSLLDAIEKGLINNNRRDDIVRHGEDVAFLKVSLDDGTEIQRKISADGNSAVKVTQNGTPIGKPETYLKSLFGLAGKGDLFNFNPVDFLNKKPTEQTSMLLETMPIEFTQEDSAKYFGTPAMVNYKQHGLKVLKDHEKLYYDKRHEANGEVKAIAAQVDVFFNQLPDGYNAEEWENVVIGDLWKAVQDGAQINKYREAAERLISEKEEKMEAVENKYIGKLRDEKDLVEVRKARINKEAYDKKAAIDAEIKTAQDKIEELRQQISVLETAIKHLESEKVNIDNNFIGRKIEVIDTEYAGKISALESEKEKEIEAIEKRVADAAEYLANNPHIDLEPLEQKAKKAEEMKGYIQTYKDLQASRENLKKAALEAEKLDGFVQLSRSLPTELLKSVDSPVEGLSIGEDGLLRFDGLTLSNLSTSEQVRKCIQIAKALNKNAALKLVCVDRLECLDGEYKKEFFRQMRNDNEWQYFGTVVTSGKMTISLLDIEHMTDEQFEDFISKFDFTWEA